MLIFRLCLFIFLWLLFAHIVTHLILRELIMATSVLCSKPWSGWLDYFFSWIPRLILLLGSSTNFQWVVEVIPSSSSLVDHPGINVLLMPLIGVLDLYVIRTAELTFCVRSEMMQCVPQTAGVLSGYYYFSNLLIKALWFPCYTSTLRFVVTLKKY
jgi:hypothetical protein